MDGLLAGLTSPQMKSRMTAVDDLQDYLERNEVTDRDDAHVLADAVATLLKENNAKVCGGALTCACLAVQGSPDLFRQHVPLFLPGVFDRLGDLKGPVREGARNLLVSLLELRVTPPADVFGKASAGWRHKNWRVREELLRTCERAFASDALSESDLSVKATLPQVLNALEDREPGVREAATSAILGAASRAGPAIHGMLARHTIRPGQLREIQARLADANLGAGVVQSVGPGSGSRPGSIGGSRPGSRPSPSSAGSDGGGATRRPGSNAGARARGVGSPSEGAERRPTSTSSTGSGGGGARGGSASSTLGNSYSSHSSTLRPSTTGGLGSTGRLIERVAAGVAQGTAGSDVPPPYGAATGRVIRIAEGDSPAPVNVDSERELSNEIERAAARLDPSKEWTDRVAAMTRLEALLLGGAAEWDCFPGLLGKLRGPLTAQVADRRSSIVRQAAHLLVVLAAELGGEFEKEAAHYVPELFKCVVITVQIIAESGDLGVRGILHNCQARALVPRLCDAASKDRSVKLRCQATGWLRLVVREWDDACLGDRGRDCVEEAILSMVKDGSNDVRAGARRVFADYARRYPDHAGRAQSRLDANTRRLIAQESAAGAYDGGGDDDWVPGAETMHARTRPHTSQEGSRLGGAGSRSGSRPAAVRVPGSRLGHSSAPVSPVDQRAGNDDDFGARAGRSNAGSSTLGRSDSLPASSKAVAHRVSGATGGHAASRNGLGSRDGARGGGGGLRAASTAGAKPAVAARVVDRAAADLKPAAKTSTGKLRRDLPSASNHLAPDLAEYGVSPEPPEPKPAPTVRSTLASAPSLLRNASWETKTEAFETLAAALRSGGAKARADAIANCAKVADMFVDHAGDAHHRVACAVLEAVVEAVPVLGPGLEPHLERLCPALFPRLVDAKESVRGLASAALAAVGDAFTADALLPALLTSLEQSKAPRAKTGVLEFALYVLSGQGGGTDPHARARGRHHPASAGTGGLGAWVARVAPLTRDRHAPLRAAAAAGLAAVHTRADQAVLLRYLATVPGVDAAAVCRAVAPHAPSIEAEFNAYADAMRNDKYGGHSGNNSGRYSDDDEDEEEAFGDDAEELRESVPVPDETDPDGDVVGGDDQRVTSGDVVAAALDRSMERLGVPPSAGGVDGAASLAGYGAEALDRRAAEVSGYGAVSRQGAHLGGKAAVSSGNQDDRADETPEVAAPPTPGVVANEVADKVSDKMADKVADGAQNLDVASLALAEAIDAASSAGPASRPRALASVRRALRAGAHPGSDRAGQVLAVALEALASEEGGDEARTHALFTLRDLAQCAPDAFAPHAAIALPRILDALSGKSTEGGAPAGVGGEVALSAGDALEGVVEALSPGAAMRALAPHVGRGGAAPVRCLGGVIARMEPETLMRSTPELIPGLVEAFNSPSADVRKAVVDTLVSMYDSLGDWLLPQLSGLSPAQQKLVTIYINRAMEKNGAGGGKGGAKTGAISIGDASRRPLAPRHQ